MTSSRKRYIKYLLLSVGLIAVLAYSAISIYVPFGKDAGAFILIGEGLLSGRLPYVELWDHKPPGIYIVAAMGILLFNSVLFLKVIILSATFLGGVLIFKLIKEEYSVNAGYIAGFSFVFTGLLYSGGQFPTETFSALALIGVLYLVKDGMSSIWDSFFVGILLGVGGLFKQPVGLVFIGIFAYVIYTSRSHLKRAIINGITITAGAILPFIPVATYYWMNESLYNIVQAVILINLNYSSETNILEIVYGLYNNIYMIPWVWVLSALGVGVYIFSRRERSELLTYSLIIYTTSMIPVLLRSYPHYLIQVAPALAIFTAVGYEEISNIKDNIPYRADKKRILLVVVIFSSVLLAPTGVQIAQLGLTAAENPITDDQQFGDRLATESSAETMMVYAAKPQYYYYAGLSPETRNIYYLPINYQSTYDSETVIETMENESPDILLIRKNCIPRLQPVCGDVRSNIPGTYQKIGEFQNRNAVLEIYMSNPPD